MLPLFHFILTKNKLIVKLLLLDYKKDYLNNPSTLSSKILTGMSGSDMSWVVPN